MARSVVKNKAIALDAKPRNEFGKGAARRARRDGLIPVVIYGPHIEPIHCLVDRLEFTAIVRNHGTNAVVEVDIEGEKQLALMKHLDQNVLTFHIDHADLFAIKRGEKVEVSVPVTYEGEIAAGAMLMQDADTILIEADVLSIPEELIIDVDGMEIGQQVQAGDVELPEGVTLIDDPEILIINVVEPEEEDLPETDSEGEEGEDDAAASEESEGDSDNSDEE
ncbi:50S ribosomal protein L25/general stress protein Ctc [Corynebacterium mendelii]|uniref:Large ribosomal subunit protein bL25 n=1 Tax=Corynebacterium mendelii TaxID=2765362 RepID=A0A939E1I6_9CORY|nr:50S ribosomal protein L25/general stress protein Ctc [Corynebacterium mendelii]MBN9644756.1 50S ribosomal protein L25/general stress protein Ctc [Corynebacterium mendelii]